MHVNFFCINYRSTFFYEKNWQTCMDQLKIKSLLVCLQVSFTKNWYLRNQQKIKLNKKSIKSNKVLFSPVIFSLTNALIDTTCMICSPHSLFKLNKLGNTKIL